MKRMYVVLGVLFLLVFSAGRLLGQQASKPVDDKIDPIEKRMRLREEMHRRMMDKLLRGIGPDEDMFSDMEKFMDEVMTDSFNGFESFSRTTSQNYKLEWLESTAGRTLAITPKSKDQKLNIDVSNGLVIIKGTTEVKSAQGVALSNFTNSFNVPGDCDPGKVKMEEKDGKILVFFPFRTATKEIRKPVAPTGGEVQI